ncbi:MAG: hypothetical protein WCV69_00975 [Patescibacteria group bacterium]|jgi:oligoribonuclease NrnB/cAMP/cGMP phosphodiesterase (DHH superfamily)
MDYPRNSVCIYHSADNDGACSAAIAKLAARVRLIPWNYGHPIPWERIPVGATIFVVDLLLTSQNDNSGFQDMERLRKIGKLVWIDHHDKAINDAKVLGLAYDGIQRVGQGACALTWEYFFPNKPMPEAVRLISNFDVFDHREVKTVHFQYGLRACNAKPWMDIWKDLLKPPFQSDALVNQLVSDGIPITKYLTLEFARYMRVCGFETILDGHRAIAVNRALVNSQIFESVHNLEDYPLQMYFYWSSDGSWKVSMRSPDGRVNCAELAAKYGGGGHSRAASFVCQELRFELKGRPDADPD